MVNGTIMLPGESELIPYRHQQEIGTGDYTKIFLIRICNLIGHLSTIVFLTLQTWALVYFWALDSTGFHVIVSFYDALTVLNK